MFWGTICSFGYLQDLSDWLGCDPTWKLLLPILRRMSGKGALNTDLSRVLLRVRYFLIYIVDLFLGQWFITLVFAGHAELVLRVRKRWRIDWCGDWWSAESTSRRCYQTPGFASCGLQSDVSEVIRSRSRSWELMEQAFDDGKNHFQMRNLLVLFLIGSKFYLIFAFFNILSPILLPLLCMPKGISLFVFVAPSVRWKRLSCWILLWKVGIPVGFVFAQSVVYV